MSVTRVANIERLRVLAAVGIVWFHTEGALYRTIAYTGLPIFLLIFFSLITLKGSQAGTAWFLRRRWNRLLAPWLFWSVLYAVCEAAQAAYVMNADSLREILSIRSLFVGTHIHLWYLPYAFASGLLIYGLNGWTSRWSHTPVILASTGIGILLLVADAIPMPMLRGMEPLPQWRFGCAAIPLGFAIGRCMMLSSHALRRRLLCAISFVTFAACIWLSLRGLTGVGIPYGLAAIGVCGAYAWPSSRSGALVSFAAPLTFGIYLVHPLVAYPVKHLLVAGGGPAAVFLLTVCISGLVTWTLMRTPVRRFV